MEKKQWCILIASVLGAMGGVFLGAEQGVTWQDLIREPHYVIGSIVSGASAVAAFFSRSPVQ